MRPFVLERGLRLRSAINVGWLSEVEALFFMSMINEFRIAI